MYPFPGFGGFSFHRDEHMIYGTDVGWIPSPTYNRQRPLGTGSDVITTLAIGSKERSFELYLTAARYNALESLLNTTAVLTDWDRPVPDSRLAFLIEVVPVEEAYSYKPTGLAQRKRRARVTFASQ